MTITGGKKDVSSSCIKMKKKDKKLSWTKTVYKHIYFFYYKLCISHSEEVKEKTYIMIIDKTYDTQHSIKFLPLLKKLNIASLIYTGTFFLTNLPMKSYKFKDM